MNSNLYKKMLQDNEFKNKKDRPYIHIIKHNDKIYSIPLLSKQSSMYPELSMKVDSKDNNVEGYLDFSKSFEILSDKLFKQSSISISIDSKEIDKYFDKLTETRKKSTRYMPNQSKALNYQRELYLKEYLKSNGLPLNNNFLCRSKEHNDSNPSMRYNQKNNTVHCFSCGVTYNLISLVQQDYEVNYKGSLKIIDDLIKSEFSDIEVDLNNYNNKVKSQLSEAALLRKTKYMKSCNDNVNETTYFKSRGIDSSVYNKMCGYDKFNNRIIAITNYPEVSYIYKDLSKNQKGYYILKDDTINLSYDLTISKNNKIFISEGIFDAMSFGTNKENYLSMNSANNVQTLTKFIKELEQINNYEYILALDNDKAGESAHDKISAFFDENKIKYSKFDLDKYNDPNEMFLKNKALFQSNISAAINTLNKRGYNMKDVEVKQAPDFPEGYMWHKNSNGENNLVTPSGDIFFSYNMNEDTYIVNGVQHSNFNSTFNSEYDSMQYFNENVYRLYESTPKITQAEFLPEGWTWTKYIDGSGRLSSPSGERVLSYDMSTNEYIEGSSNSYSYGYDEISSNTRILENRLFRNYNKKNGIDHVDVNEKLVQLNFSKRGLLSELPIYQDQNGNYWGKVNYSTNDAPEFRKFDDIMDIYDNWEEKLSQEQLISEYYPNANIEIITDNEIIQLNNTSVSVFDDIPIYEDENGNQWININYGDLENPEYRQYKDSTGVDNSVDFKLNLRNNPSINDFYPYAEVEIIDANKKEEKVIESDDIVNSIKKDEYELIQLRYARSGHFDDIPIYEDQNGEYWGNLNYSDIDNPEFRKFETFMDDYDDWQFNLKSKQLINDFYPNAQVEIIADYERNPALAFNYQLLGRYLQDVEYFLGYGGQHLKHLYKENIDEHINKMIELHESFPEDKKPEWLSMDEIKDFGKKMSENYTKKETEKTHDLQTNTFDEFIENFIVSGFDKHGEEKNYGLNAIDGLYHESSFKELLFINKDFAEKFIEKFSKEAEDIKLKYFEQGDISYDEYEAMWDKDKLAEQIIIDGLLDKLKESNYINERTNFSITLNNESKKIILNELGIDNNIKTRNEDNQMEKNNAVNADENEVKKVDEEKKEIEKVKNDYIDQIKALNLNDSAAAKENLKQLEKIGSDFIKTIKESLKITTVAKTFDLVGKITSVKDFDVKGKEEARNRSFWLEKEDGKKQQCQIWLDDSKDNKGVEEGNEVTLKGTYNDYKDKDGNDKYNFKVYNVKVDKEIEKEIDNTQDMEV